MAVEVVDEDASLLDDVAVPRVRRLDGLDDPVGDEAGYSGSLTEYYSDVAESREAILHEFPTLDSQYE